MSASRCSASARERTTKSARMSGGISGSSSASSMPRRPVRGVRSSCDTLATNWERSSWYAVASLLSVSVMSTSRTPSTSNGTSTTRNVRRPSTNRRRSKRAGSPVRMASRTRADSWWSPKASRMPSPSSRNGNVASAAGLTALMTASASTRRLATGRAANTADRRASSCGTPVGAASAGSTCCGTAAARRAKMTAPVATANATRAMIHANAVIPPRAASGSAPAATRCR